MSTEQTLNLENFVIMEFTSKNGEKYAVGYPKDAGYTKENVIESIQVQKKEQGEKASDWVNINWPVGSYNHPTSSAVSNIGISNANVTTYSIIWKYNIQFTNTKGWGFSFKDETGDVYRISTFRNGFHYLLYNSPKPTIVGVK